MNAPEKNQRISLLWPEGSPAETEPGASRWGDHTVIDLNLETLAEYLSPNYQEKSSILKFLLALTTDLEVIRYRQEILDDCLHLPKIVSMLAELQAPLAEMERIGGPCPMDRTPLHKTIYRLGELELYVRCVQTLSATLAEHRNQISSRGLRQLAKVADEIGQQPVFQKMAKELPTLRARFDSIASLTIGINLDEELRPVEAALLSFQPKPFKQGTLLGKLFLPGSKEDQQGIAPLHAVPIKTVRGMAQEVVGIEREDPMLYPLFRDLDKILKEITKPVAQTLTQYLQVNTQSLVQLGSEIAFYLCGLRLHQKLTAANLPICKPEPAPVEDRICDIDELYNIHLVLRMIAGGENDLPGKIIPSDVHFGEEGRIFILTGPNRGGKTTFTEAIGLAQILFQAGLHIPAKTARISPVEGIFTHFPLEERPDMDAGRLGEEASRLGEIFRNLTRHSLLLLNETFSTTSPGEGVYLAQDVIRAIRKLGARAVFATHLHELGHVDAINSDTEGDSLAASLVAGSFLEPGTPADAASARRTYRIEPGPPQGMSHARDIARKYGIEFNQLMATLKARNAV